MTYNLHLESRGNDQLRLSQLEEVVTDAAREDQQNPMIAVEQDAMALKLKYVPEFRKVLSGQQTALFYQIEWRLDLMINLQLAQAPLIEP